MPGWHYLGEGTFNCVYQGTINGSPVVYKVAKTFTSNPSYKSTVVMDIPSRSVRLWDEINPDLLPTACLYREGWIAPFVEGSKPAALEVCDALIELYQRTGRIVVDAISSGNFKKNKSGKIICVDIGFALRLEKESDEEKSESSLNFWVNQQEMYRRYFKKYEKENEDDRTIIETIKALLVLQHFRPDTRVLSPIKRGDLIKRLAAVYGDSKQIKLPEALSEEINEILPINIAYFSKVYLLLKPILSKESYSIEIKAALCKAHLKNKLSLSQVGLVQSLINLNLNAFEVISYVAKLSHEDAGILRGCCLILYLLDQAALFSRSNADQVRSHRNFFFLYRIIALFFRIGILMQDNFNHVISVKMLEEELIMKKLVDAKILTRDREISETIEIELTIHLLKNLIKPESLSYDLLFNQLIWYEKNPEYRSDNVFFDELYERFKAIYETMINDIREKLTKLRGPFSNQRHLLFQLETILNRYDDWVYQKHTSLISDPILSMIKNLFDISEEIIISYSLVEQHAMAFSIFAESPKKTLERHEQEWLSQCHKLCDTMGFMLAKEDVSKIPSHTQ